MIYEIVKGKDTFEIDDNVFFNRQIKEFKTIFEELAQDNIAAFDNCSVLVFANGKIVVTPKNIDNE
ncbi:MAG: hypothetical protein QM660_06065 [Dysgonomonas sp.]